VHVAYVLIDAVIDLEWTRKRFANAPDHFFITPAAIAEEVWHVAHQDRCAWSFNVEIKALSRDLVSVRSPIGRGAEGFGILRFALE